MAKAKGSPEVHRAPAVPGRAASVPAEVARAAVARAEAPEAAAREAQEAEGQEAREAREAEGLVAGGLVEAEEAVGVVDPAADAAGSPASALSTVNASTGPA